LHVFVSMGSEDCFVCFFSPADKASNNIVFVCKSYYFEYLIKELGINSNTSSNTT
jgi:hypothetical protein